MKSRNDPCGGRGRDATAPSLRLTAPIVPDAFVPLPLEKQSNEGESRTEAIGMVWPLKTDLCGGC
jgi:hypothetical protein